MQLYFKKKNPVLAKAVDLINCLPRNELCEYLSLQYYVSGILVGKKKMDHTASVAKRIVNLEM